MDPRTAYAPLPRGPVVSHTTPLGGYGPQRGGAPNVPHAPKTGPLRPTVYGPPNSKPGPAPLRPVASVAEQNATRAAGMAVNNAKLREGAKNLRNGGG
jgi:hypothetical protein